MKTIWLWSGIWRWILSVVVALMVNHALIFFITSTLLMSFIGFLLGAFASMYSLMRWPCWRFEFK